MSAINEADPMSMLPIAEPPPQGHTTLLKLKARQCRFIVSGEVRKALFCGAPTTNGSSWCAWHRQLVYTPRSLNETAR